MQTGAKKRGWLLAGAVGTGLCLGPAAAHAGGFEIPGAGSRGLGRAGAYTVGVEDITALHYNPGALAKQRGTTITWNQTLFFHNTTFSRSPLGEGLPDPGAVWGPDAGTTFDTASSSETFFPLGIFGGVTSDFGLENWAFGLAIHGPNGVGKTNYEAYGPQSFMLTNLDVLMAYYTVGAAWKLRDVFGIGLTVSYVDLIQLKYGLVIDSTLTQGLNPIPDEASTQLVNELELSDRANATAGLGLWYRPHRRVEIGAAARIVPVFLKPEGKVNVDKPELVTDDVTVTLPFQLPANFRAGVRYIHDTGQREWFDIELDVVYENWGAIESFDLSLDGTINGQALNDISLPKNWKDTVSVRLGGDVNVLDPYLTLRAGGFFETGAMEDVYSHIDFPSFDRGGVSAGFSAGAKGIYFTAGYMFVQQEQREVNELTSKVFQQRPLRPCPENCNGASGVPANSGVFESRYHLLSMGLDIRFGELLAKRRARKAKDKAAKEEATEPATVQTSGPADAGTSGPETEAEPENVQTSGPADAGTSGPEPEPENVQTSGPADAGTSGPEPEPEPQDVQTSGPADAGTSGPEPEPEPDAPQPA